MFVFAVCFFYELSKWACETTRTRDVDSLALDLWPIQDTFRLCVVKISKGVLLKCMQSSQVSANARRSTRVLYLMYLHLIKQDRFPRNSHHRHA